MIGFNNRRKEDMLRTFAYTCGTNTARFRHLGVCNIPRVGTYYGEELRSLFTTGGGFDTLVGCDASQLEARIEGHFTAAFDGGEYADFLLNADIHQAHADAWGLSRNDAKAPGYALSYQCSYKKVQELLECTPAQAKSIHKAYWDMRPAAQTLITALEGSVKSRVGDTKDLWNKRAWIKGIDGRKLWIRSMHSLKNALIQNAGMIAMKMAYVYLDKTLQKYDIPARIVMFYHDEFQILTTEKYSKRVEELAKQCIVKAGEELKLRIPLAAEAKSGNNWAETH